MLLYDSQIIAILKQAETGSPVRSCTASMVYKRAAKYGGMVASLMARTKELEDENRRLKKMYAEERIKAESIA